MKNMLLLILCMSMTACTSLLPAQPTSASMYSDLVISMERGPCFGTCPIYELTIYANGTVDYEGQEFVKVKGKRNAKIDSDQIQELVDAIEHAKFFSLEDQYMVPVTDLPSVTLSITLDGRSKRIWHYGILNCSGPRDDAPPELCELEKKIDEVTNSKRWVKDQ